MKILGLSFDYHDSAAALVVDGRVVAAASEERFSRVKNDAGFPANAARFCLEQGGLSAADLDAVVHYERPLKKFDRVLRSAIRRPSRAKKVLGETLVDWFRAGKFEVRARIADALGVPAGRIDFADHHDSHAAAAFFCSPFDEAAVVTLDGVGEFDTATISHGRGLDIENLSRVEFPNSIGLFYSAFTAFLGFEINEGEYKVMGMAGFGEPKHAEAVLGLFDLRADGTFALKQDLFDFLAPEDRPFLPTLEALLGPARAPETPFNPRATDPKILAESRRYADIAASVQRATEEVILHVVRAAMRRTGRKEVCLAGGVALNSVANGRIKRELGARLYVQPAAGDAGSAIGAALHRAHRVERRPRSGPLVSPYLGRAFSADEIRAALDEAYVEPELVHADDAALAADIAARLADGKVIGWLQGRAEWGPRALGARSILADPRRAEMQSVVNEKIKFRETFRPFAPSVLAERAHEFFELDPVRDQTDPEHFMLAVAKVREAAKAIVPATTHADGTARVHLVDARANPIFHALIAAFGARTGVPIVLNTSFNLRGEPIVNSPADAIRTFQWCGMDALVLGRAVLSK
jgi:carbamoyltransferase